MHTCAIRSLGKLYCWGNDGSGQVGNGPGGSPTVPVQITTATDWKSVDAGAAHTCAIRGAGLLYCWGDDTVGQLGNGSAASSSPVAIRITSATDWKSVSAGSTHTCVIRSTGKLYCWGNDDAASDYDDGGQLGNGPGGSSQVPIQITTAVDWKSVTAGSTHTCGIRSVGKLYCWGNDKDGDIPGAGGQLGNGDGGSSEVAIQITSATDWKVVSAGSRHTCAIRSTGKLYCWGYDAQGQVGNGADAGGLPTTYPVQI